MTNIDFKDIIKTIILNHGELNKTFNNKHPNSKYSLDLIINEIIYVLKTGISWRNIRSPIKWNMQQEIQIMQDLERARALQAVANTSVETVVAGPAGTQGPEGAQGPQGNLGPIGPRGPQG